MDTKIYGVWENSELKYYLNNDGSLKIFWKKKQAECTGLYNLSEDMIFFRYGKNHSIKWSGLIEVLDDNFLQIRDLSNEIGKIDSFKKTPITFNEIFNLKAIQSEIIIGNIKSYPQIHLPIEIIKNFDKIFPPPTKPTHPIEPIKPSKKDTLFVFFFGTIIALILLYFNQFIFGFIIICLLIYILFSNSEQKDYIEKLKKYNFDLTSFYKSLKEYEDELKIIDQQSYQTYKRNKAKYNIINNSAKHLINIDYKKGISHDYFKEYLFQTFGDSIIESTSIDNSKYPSYYEYDMYVTDFLYIDRSTNLKMDIEIDEPYTFGKKQPIHLNDKIRNDFFIENNWIVIRFAEEQVINYPELCCKLISDLIHNFHNDFLLLKSLKSEIPIVTKWNSQSVIELIAVDYRNTYLKHKNL